MKRKYLNLIFSLVLFALIFMVISIFSVKQNKVTTGKKMFLNENNVVENVNFTDISTYHYNAENGSFVKGGVTYTINVTDDGVLKIYNGATEVARSKETALSLEIYKKIYKEEADAIKAEENDRIAHAHSDKTECNADLYSVYQSTFHNVICQIATETNKKIQEYIENEYTSISDSDDPSIIIKKVTLPTGTYLVDGGYDSPSVTVDKSDGIVIPTNTCLDLNSSVIKQIRNNHNINGWDDNGTYKVHGNHYNIFRIDKGNNITIKNGKLLGDKAERTRALNHELGAGIMIRPIDDGSGNYVTINKLSIENLDIGYMLGDGIYTNGKNTTVDSTFTCDNVIITGCNIHDCNRQGISLENNKSISIVNNTIENIIGTLPSACIDIEPPMNSAANDRNRAYYLVDNVTIKNNKFKNDFVLYENIMNNNGEPEEMTHGSVIDCMFATGDVNIEGNSIAGRMLILNVDGKINFKSNKFFYIHSKCILSLGTYEDWYGDDKKMCMPYNKGNNHYYKRNPECVIIDSNDFYGYHTTVYDGKYVDIKNNTYHKYTGNLETQGNQYVLATEERWEKKCLVRYYEGEVYIPATDSDLCNKVEDISGTTNIPFNILLKGTENVFTPNQYTNGEPDCASDVGYIRVLQPSKKLVYRFGLADNFTLGDIANNIKADTRIGVYKKNGDILEEILGTDDRVDYFFTYESKQSDDDIELEHYRNGNDPIGYACFDKNKVLDYFNPKIGIKLNYTDESNNNHTLITYQKIKIHKVESINKFNIKERETGEYKDYNVTNSINKNPHFKIGDRINKDTIRIKFMNDGYKNYSTGVIGSARWRIVGKTDFFESADDELILSEEHLDENNQITLEAKYYGVTASMKFIVDVPERIEISGPEAIYVGDAVQLNKFFYPANSYANITYQTSDSNVARVNENGVVRAVGIGQCTITATTGNGKTATYQVNSQRNLKDDAIKEVANSYYMRKRNIQYNSSKGLEIRFSPEEATSQNINYMTCTGFTNNVYKELLGIDLPVESNKLVNYAYSKIGRPEVIAYGEKVVNEDETKYVKMIFYDSSPTGVEIPNPNLENDIIPRLQIR